MVREPLVLAAALRLVGLAGRMVPRALREEWKREWRAELWHLYHSSSRRSIGEDPAFALRAMGSLLDALQLRAGDAQAWSESVSVVVSRWSRHTPSVAVALLLLSIGIAADALLLAFGSIALSAPLPAGTGVVQVRTVLLGVGVSCGVAMIVASAGAAAQLLGAGETTPRDEVDTRVVEMALIAGVTAWLARWLVALGMHAVRVPESSWLAAMDPGAAATSAWLVSWLLGLTLLVIVRSRRPRPVRILP